jgi:hypothetical protein
MYRTHNYWVFGICLSSGILRAGEHNVSETGFVSVFKWREGISQWLSSAVFEAPTEKLSPLTWGRKRIIQFSKRCVPKSVEYRMMDRVRKPIHSKRPFTICPPLWSSGLVVRVPGYRSGGPGSIPDATWFPEKCWVWNGVPSASWVQLRNYLEENVAAPV